MKITTRHITQNDIGTLAKLYVKVYEHFDVGESWDIATAEKMLHWNFSRCPELAYCAQDKDALVGAFMVAVKPWWDGNHLVDGEIFVDPYYQQQGIGSLLTKQVLTKAKELFSVVSWDTYTFKNHSHPLSWYKSLGFEAIDEWVMISGNVSKALDHLK